MRLFAFFNLTCLFLTAVVLTLFFLVNSKSVTYGNGESALNLELSTLPRNPFAQKEESFVDLEKSPLALEWVSPKMSLPDLREELLYQGKNHRPDMAEGKSRFQIGLKKSGEVKVVLGGEKVYLKHLSSKRHSDEPFSKGSYIFSNTPTSLWLEMTPLTADASGAEYLEVHVYLSDEENFPVITPSQYHLFTLKAEDKKNPSAAWEIGGCRVDPTLLLRQGARLAGRDVFLEMHGGNDFAYVNGRERIDFLAGDNPYSCFVKEKDFLIWKNEKWLRPEENEKTDEYSLFVVKKVDDKAIGIEIWDKEGKNKVVLNLVRFKNHEPIPDLAQEIKFLGARTWVECIVECRAKRFLLKEGDWLVLSEEGWSKITSMEEVDNYVNQKLNGPLFILDKIAKKNNRTILVGHLFNTSRTEVTHVELNAQ